MGYHLFTRVEGPGPHISLESNSCGQGWCEIPKPHCAHFLVTFILLCGKLYTTLLPEVLGERGKSG